MSEIATILDRLPSTRESLQQLREILLANAVMFGEIPSPTFYEEKRVRFMQDRFVEAGLQNVSGDEAGNAFGVFPGKQGDRHILISAHLDTPFATSVDHAVAVHPDRMVGPGIMDNSLGVAAVASLPTILEKLGIELDDHLLLMGSARSLGRGDIQGLRFFLENNQLPLRSAVCLEGGTLGRLSYRSLGVLRGVISINIPEDYDFSGFGAVGAIPILNRVINRILAIPVPQEPWTRIILGSLDAGTAYNIMARQASLRFEIRSEGTGVVAEIQDQLNDIVSEIGSMTGARIVLEPVARRKTGGLTYTHPLVRCARQTLDKAGVEIKAAPSTGELAALIEREIPGITIGLTRGGNRSDYDESIEIEPIFTGLAQLITLIQMIDGGHADEQD